MSSRESSAPAVRQDSRDEPFPPSESAPVREAFPASLPMAPAEAAPEEMQKEAIETAEQLRTRFPRQTSALHVAAMFYADLRQTNEAEEIWRECLALDPNHGGAHVGLASVASGRGDNDSAVKTLRDALDKGCSSPEVYYHLASSLAKLGKPEEAATAAQQGVQLFSQSPELWLVLGQNQLRLGRLGEAEASLRKAISLGAVTEEAYFALANACARQGKNDEAAEFRERFNQLKANGAAPDGKWTEVAYPAMVRHLTAAVLVNASEIYIQENAFADAERLLLRAIALEPENTRALSRLSTLCYGQKRLAPAQLVLRRLVEVEPQNPFHWLNLANVSSELGDAPAAEAAYKKLIAMTPDAAFGYARLAELYLKHGELAKGRSLVEEALRREPTAEGYLMLASICRELDDSAAAEQAERQAQELSGGGLPEFPKRP